MPVGPYQHGLGSGDVAQDRELPHPHTDRVDPLDPRPPRRDVETPGLTEVQQHGPGVLQQGVHAQRAVGADQVEIGHATPE
jgi:hypothetical protein